MEPTRIHPNPTRPSAAGWANTGIWLAAAGIGMAGWLTMGRRRSERADLEGARVLISGGTRGFGLALARELASGGARLALCARDEQEAESARALLEQQGFEAHVFTCDITKPGEPVAAVGRAVEQLGGLDMLINNAGRIAVAPFESFTHSDFEEAMDLMFWAPLNMIYAALPHLRESRGGRIVNVTSLGGRVSVPHLLPYCCAKFAMVGLSTGLATELRPQGIRVLTVVPGLMRTGSYLNAEFKGQSKKEYGWFGVLGNLPGFTVSASYAARKVRDAIETNDRVCTISLPAELLIALDSLAPETSEMLKELVLRVMPAAGGPEGRKGRELNPAFGSWFQALTKLGRQAASGLNEYPTATS